MTKKKQLLRFEYATQTTNTVDYKWKVHRYATDDPYGVLTLKEYRAHNRPSLWRVEIQPWMSPRDEWYYQLPGEDTELVGPFKELESAKAAMLLAFGAGKYVVNANA